MTKNRLRVMIASISLAALLIVPTISNATSNSQHEQLSITTAKKQDHRFDIEKNSKFRETFGCVSGGNTDNSNCGTIISTNFSGTVAGGGYYSGQTEANYKAVGGDSGGPTFSAYQLMGIHVATNLGNSYDNLYSRAARVLGALGVTAITGY